VCQVNHNQEGRDGGQADGNNLETQGEQGVDAGHGVGSPLLNVVFASGRR